MNDSLFENIKDTADLVEAEIVKTFCTADRDVAALFDSIRYSACGGGKRIRPFITFAIAEMLSAPKEVALAFATAVECIHTYSLIHDDLPCMDNDDLRRGKATNHKVFGEAVALLAGDALLTEAFRLISDAECNGNIKSRAISILSSAAGCRGMIGGQMIDINTESREIPFELLLKMHSMKTGALICAAAELGAIAADCKDEDILSRIKLYAKNIGLAFQIEDDVLDAAESCATENACEDTKTTFMSFMTPEEAMEYAARLTDEAKSAIASVNGSDKLLSLADHLLKRRV